MINFLIGGPRYGCQNVGDEGILTAIVNDIRELAPDAHITVLTDNQDATTARLNIEPKPLGGWLNRVREMSKADIFVCGGATILSDCPRTVLKLVLVAKILRKPVMVYGVGMDPLPDVQTQRLVRLAGNAADVISVRDQDVRQRLVEYGVNPDKVFATADPATLLEPVAPDRVTPILLEQGLQDQPRPWIGIGISGESDIRHITPCPTLAQAADHLVTDLGASIIFIPMNTRSDQDIPLLEKIQGLMAYRDRTRLLTGKYTPEEMLGIVKQMDLIISSRLHLLIFSAVVNVPMVGISRSAKIDSFLERVSRVSAGSVAEITMPKIVDTLSGVWNNFEAIKSELSDKTSKMKNDALLNRQLLGKLLIQKKLVSAFSE